MEEFWWGKSILLIDLNQNFLLDLNIVASGTKFYTPQIALWDYQTLSRLSFTAHCVSKYISRK
jgi:hypothetical protein